MDDFKSIFLNVLSNGIWVFLVWLFFGFLALVGWYAKGPKAPPIPVTSFKHYVATEALRMVRQIAVFLVWGYVVYLITGSLFSDFFWWKHVVAWAAIFAATAVFGSAFYADPLGDSPKRTAKQNTVIRRLSLFTNAAFSLWFLLSLVEFIYFDPKMVAARWELHQANIRLEVLGHRLIAANERVAAAQLHYDQAAAHLRAVEATTQASPPTLIRVDDR